MIQAESSSSRHATTLTETLTRVGKAPLRSMRQIVDRESPVRWRTSPNRRSLSGTGEDALRVFSTASAVVESELCSRATPFDMIATPYSSVSAYLLTNRAGRRKVQRPANPPFRNQFQIESGPRRPPRV
jgi:hypothetical protein